jgi:uncharacterized sulfatase
MGIRLDFTGPMAKPCLTLETDEAAVLAELSVQLLDPIDRPHWEQLVTEHHYLQSAALVGEQLRVPLILATPGQKTRGKASPRTVELLDLYPTLAEVCGLTPPHKLAGRSLTPLLEDPQATRDKPAFTQVWRGGFPGHSVRTERWRYTEWDEGRRGVQLTDYQADPREERNLADDPATAAIVAELRALVRKNWETSHRPPAAKPAKR